jgi:hypothetical protein
MGLLDMEWSVTVFDRKSGAGCPAYYSSAHAIRKDWLIAQKLESRAAVRARRD